MADQLELRRKVHGWRGWLALGGLALSALGATPGSLPAAAALPAPGAKTPSAVVPGADWVVEAPSAHGMVEATLDQAYDYAFQPGRNTQGVVVVRDGVIVREWYAPGAGPTSWGASWSMAKSFTSALIGIAIDDGLIPSVDVPMTTYFPDWVGTPKASITLRNVLHMESGLDWEENYDPSSLATSEIIAMVGTQQDQLAYAAGIPLGWTPGTSFNYSSGDTMLLSGVLQQATGMSVHAYARQELLDPIGIQQFEWWSDADGNTLTYCCVDTTSRDFARFGLLYLRGGVWDTTQVVPASWVTDSINDIANSYPGYGYQWWLDMVANGGMPPYFSARGHDGQYIYVIPSLDLVVVRNGTYVKSPCPPVADPNLIYYYPPSGLVPGQGTTPPDNGWSDIAFLGPIVESITGVPVTAKHASAAPDRDDADGGRPGSAKAPAADPAPCPTPATTPTTAPVPVVDPAFAG